MQNRDPNGLTEHDLLLEIRSDLKHHMRDYRRTELRIQLALAKRPTRAEIVRWAGAASGVLVLVMAFS